MVMYEELNNLGLQWKWIAMGIKHRAEGLKKQWGEGTLHEP